MLFWSSWNQQTSPNFSFFSCQDDLALVCGNDVFRQWPILSRFSNALLLWSTGVQTPRSQGERGFLLWVTAPNGPSLIFLYQIFNQHSEYITNSLFNWILYESLYVSIHPGRKRNCCWWYPSPNTTSSLQSLAYDTESLFSLVYLYLAFTSKTQHFGNIAMADLMIYLMANKTLLHELFGIQCPLHKCTTIYKLG